MAVANTPDAYVNITKAFIPIGFDDNDRSVQITIAGELPSSCYQLGETETFTEEVAGETKIVIRQPAYLTKALCIPVAMPFVRYLDLGRLSAGRYAIEAAGKGNLSTALGELTVDAVEGDGPDSKLYAPITSAYVAYNKKKDQHELILRGNFPTRCMKFKEIVIKPAQTDDVIVVLPEVEKIGKVPCTPSQSRYQTKQVIDQKLGNQTYLFHIRAMGGAALNIPYSRLDLIPAE